ncbi:MAG: glycosyltransferase family 2 protein [Eubacteriales bacterium]|nr:glycosyltransferase family 2 protein [Eubacteriales bacterium]
MCEISVIVPVYQVEAYIGRCLESILRQTFTDYEIIIVDDNGKDRSMDIVRKYRRKYPDKFRILINDGNQGLGVARDNGMSVASGTFITFVDSDDYLSPDYLERYYNAIMKPGEGGRPRDLVAGGFLRASGKKIKAFPANKRDPWYLWMNVNAWGKLYRRSFLEEHQITFRGVRQYEDGQFAYYCLLADPEVHIIKYEGYFYCDNPNSITTAKKDRTPYFLEYVEQCRGFLEEADIPDEKWEIVQYCWTQALTVNLLYNGKGCGRRRMIDDLYPAYDQMMHVLSGDVPLSAAISLKTGTPGVKAGTGRSAVRKSRNFYGQVTANRFVNLRIPKSEPTKSKWACRIVMAVRTQGMDEFLFRLVSHM